MLDCALSCFRSRHVGRSLKFGTALYCNNLLRRRAGLLVRLWLHDNNLRNDQSTIVNSLDLSYEISRWLCQTVRAWFVSTQQVIIAAAELWVKRPMPWSSLECLKNIWDQSLNVLELRGQTCTHIDMLKASTEVQSILPVNIRILRLAIQASDAPFRVIVLGMHQMCSSQALEDKSAFHLFQANRCLVLLRGHKQSFTLQCFCITCS